ARARARARARSRRVLRLLGQLLGRPDAQRRRPPRRREPGRQARAPRAHVRLAGPAPRQEIGQLARNAPNVSALVTETAATTNSTSARRAGSRSTGRTSTGLGTAS